RHGQAVGDEMGLVAIGFGEPLREPPFLADGAEHAHQLDDYQRGRETPEGVGAVVAARDEEKRQASGETGEEAEEVGLTAAGERREIAARAFARRSGLQATRPSEVSGRASSSLAIVSAGSPSRSRQTASAIGMATPCRSASATRTGAVCAPSATVRRSLIRVVGFSPWPSALPSEKLRLDVEEHVSTRSPSPQSPASVARCAPSASPKRCISA